METMKQVLTVSGQGCEKSRVYMSDENAPLCEEQNSARSIVQEQRRPL
jgi:hypothetical protein